MPAMAEWTLLGTPGITQLVTTSSLSTAANRGAWDLAGIPYFVNGDTLYRLDRTIISGVETFSTTSLGTISGSGRVSMADNGTQLMILVPGGNGYIYTVAGGLVAISDLDFTANGNPQYVVFIDGYFACSTDSKKWIVSALNDGTSWNALDVGSAESDPDTIVAPIVYNNQIYITGSETTEAFQNIGGAGFPFQRSNIFISKGCYAPASLISFNQRIFMVGGGKNERAGIWMYAGGEFEKISTIPIDDVMAGYTDTSLAATFAMAWGSRGQLLVAFTFVDRTFVYNITTQLWHEVKSGIPNSTTGDLEQMRWRVNSMVTAYGYNLVGDSQDGRIGKLDTDVYTEYDNNIIRVMATPPLANEGKSFRLPRIELTLEAGVGIDGTVDDPMVSMAISKDMKTYAYERNRSIGPAGQYGRRTVWRKNGRVPRYCILQFRLSDPIKPVIIKIEASII